MTGEIFTNLGKEPYLSWCDSQAKFSAPDQQDGNIIGYELMIDLFYLSNFLIKILICYMKLVFVAVYELFISLN
jgi:hypothetical protein